MKKIFLILSILLCFMLSTINVFGASVNSYDKYGTKTGSYRETSSGYNTYNKYKNTIN